MEALMLVVLRWAGRRGLDEAQTATAQSLAWWYRETCKAGDAAEYPDSHWARLAVRAVRHGRDLPGCGTGQADALNHSVQGAAMNGVWDRSPGPDVLADHKERYGAMMDHLSEVKRLVVQMRLEGLSNFEISQALGVSPGRTSQIARQIAEAFGE